MQTQKLIKMMLSINPQKSLIDDGDQAHKDYRTKLRGIAAKVDAASNTQITDELEAALIGLINAPVYTTEAAIAYKFISALHAALSKENVNTDYFSHLFDAIYNESPTLYPRALETLMAISASLSDENKKKLAREFAMQAERFESRKKELAEKEASIAKGVSSFPATTPNTAPATQYGSTDVKTTSTIVAVVTDRKETPKLISTILAIHPKESLIDDKLEAHKVYHAGLRKIAEQFDKANPALLLKEFEELTTHTQLAIRAKLIELINAPVYTIEARIAYKILNVIHDHLAKETIDTHFFNHLFDTIHNESPSLYHHAVETVTTMSASLSDESKKKLAREFAIQQSHLPAAKAELAAKEALVTRGTTSFPYIPKQYQLTQFAPADVKQQAAKPETTAATETVAPTMSLRTKTA